MNENIICIVAGYSRSGEYNPGLESMLGKTQAEFLARSILLDTISTSLSVPDTRVCIAYWPAEHKEHFENLLFLFENEETDVEIASMARDVSLIPQMGLDLGQRLVNLSNRLFSEGAGRTVLVVPGSPLLQPLVLQASFELLKKNQAIVGPTFDGGYYLIGSDANYPSIFEGIDWDDPCVYKNTVERLDKIGLTWQELEISYKISSPEELEQLYIDIDNLRLTGENRIAFHTERCLANLSR